MYYHQLESSELRVSDDINLNNISYNNKTDIYTFEMKGVNYHLQIYENVKTGNTGHTGNIGNTGSKGLQNKNVLGLTGGTGSTGSGSPELNTFKIDYNDPKNNVITLYNKYFKEDLCYNNKYYKYVQDGNFYVWIVKHNLNSKNLSIKSWNQNDIRNGPDEIEYIDNNTVKLKFYYYSKCNPDESNKFSYENNLNDIKLKFKDIFKNINYAYFYNFEIKYNKSYYKLYPGLNDIKIPTLFSDIDNKLLNNGWIRKDCSYIYTGGFPLKWLYNEDVNWNYDKNLPYKLVEKQNIIELVDEENPKKYENDINWVLHPAIDNTDIYTELNNLNTILDFSVDDEYLKSKNIYKQENPLYSHKDQTIFNFIINNNIDDNVLKLISTSIYDFYYNYTNIKQDSFSIDYVSDEINTKLKLYDLEYVKQFHLTGYINSTSSNNIINESIFRRINLDLNFKYNTYNYGYKYNYNNIHIILFIYNNDTSDDENINYNYKELVNLAVKKNITIDIIGLHLNNIKLYYDDELIYLSSYTGGTFYELNIIDNNNLKINLNLILNNIGNKIKSSKRYLYFRTNLDYRLKYPPYWEKISNIDINSIPIYSREYFEYIDILNNPGWILKNNKYIYDGFNNEIICLNKLGEKVECLDPNSYLDE